MNFGSFFIAIFSEKMEEKRMKNLLTKEKVKEFIPNKKVIACLVALSLLLGGWTIYHVVRQNQFENQVLTAQTEAVEQMANKTVYQRVYGDYSGDDVNTLRPGGTVDPSDLISKYGVGMIAIPSIGLELPVLEGITQANISIGAGTVKPNQRIGHGNFALLGHYMTNSGLLFGGLKNVKTGDEVELTYYGKTETYIVQETKIVHQSEGQYMLDDPEKPHYLTLITCDGSRAGTDYRTIVRATLKNN